MPSGVPDHCIADTSCTLPLSWTRGRRCGSY
jgi:hypothetical protein